MIRKILLLLASFAILFSFVPAHAANRLLVVEDMSIGSGTYTSPSGRSSGTKLNASSFTFPTSALDTKSPADWASRRFNTPIYPSSMIAAGPEVSIQRYDDDNDGAISNSELATAISAIGAVHTTLLIDATVTPTAAHTFPATTTLRFVRPGKFTKSGSATITINGPLISAAYQIFESFTADDVEFGIIVADAYVEWFGGAADNSTINNTPFASLIAAIPSEGGTIRLLPGIYLIQTSAIVIAKANIRLIGAGMYATTIKQVTNGIICIVINTGATDILIQGIKFDGTGSYSAGFAGRSAVDVNQSNDNPGGSGNATPKRIHIKECAFVKPDMTGFSTGSSEDVWVTRCYFKDVGEHGIYFSGSATYTKRGKVVGNYLENTTQATSYLINLKIIDDILVDGNTLVSTDGVGAAIMNVDLASGPTDARIVNNRFESASMAGGIINLGGVRTKFKNNTIVGGATSGNGITIRTDGAVIENNDITSCLTVYGITTQETGLTDLQINGNKITDCKNGIQIGTPGARCTMKDNYVYNGVSTGSIGYYFKDGAVVDGLFSGNRALNHSTPFTNVSKAIVRRNNRDDMAERTMEARYVFGVAGAGVADGAANGKAKTTNSVTYELERGTYTKGATDNLFDLTSVTTGGSDFKKVVLCLDSSGDGQIIEGTVAASQATAKIPWVRVDYVPVGIVELGNSYSGGDLSGNTFYDIIGDYFSD